MKLSLKSTFVGIYLTASIACLNPFERSGEKVPIGPDAPFSFVVYFKLGTTEGEVESFKESVLTEPRSDGRGRNYKEGIGSYLRFSPRKGNGHWGFAITFYTKTSEEQRAKIKESIISHEFVYRIFENVAPIDIQESDLN